MEDGSINLKAIAKKIQILLNLIIIDGLHEELAFDVIENREKMIVKFKELKKFSKELYEKHNSSITFTRKTSCFQASKNEQNLACMVCQRENIFKLIICIVTILYLY